MPSRSELSEGQDWASVVLNGTTTNHKQTHNAKRVENEVDEKKHPFIGNELKLAIQKARTGQGLSQKELAHRMNTQVQLINLYECGRAIPDNAFIAKMEKKRPHAQYEK